MPLIDMHDYSRAARRTWWTVVLCGAPVIAWSAWQLAMLPWVALATALAGIGMAAALALFPMRFFGTRMVVTPAEVFILLVLMTCGVEAAVMAAVVDAFTAACLSSRRWTSRLFAPTMVAACMWVLGSGFVAGRDAAQAAGLGPPGYLAVALAFSYAYFAVTMVLTVAMPALKRGEPLRPITWLRERWMIGAWFLTSGAVAALVFLAYEHFGWAVLLVAVPLVAMFISNWHALQRLDSVSRHKTEFLANMSHELRTPLNSIIGGAEILRDGIVGPLTPAQARWAHDIHESGMHLLSLINDLLDLSRIESGHMELELAPCEVGSVVSQAVLLVSDAAARNGIRIGHEVAADVGMLVADERRLKQVLVNLLANAVKFTPAGGRVAVAARRVGDVVEIGVADDGVGIAKAEQQAIFEPFRQAGSDRGKKAEGTGLGLALVRDLVVLHGGSVEVQSEPGRGAVFTVRLPDRAVQRLREPGVEMKRAETPS